MKKKNSRPGFYRYIVILNLKVTINHLLRKKDSKCNWYKYTYIHILYIQVYVTRIHVIGEIKRGSKPKIEFKLEPLNTFNTIDTPLLVI